MKRFGLRGRLTVVVALAAAVVLAALTAGFNLALRASLHHDADQVLTARATAALATLDVRGGRVHSAEAPSGGPVDARIWVYSGSKAVEKPAGPGSLQRAAESLSGASRGYAEDPATDTKLYAVPVLDRGRPAGTVVAGIALEPYERTASRALIGSLLFAGAVLLLIMVAVRWVVGGALRPVARMTAQAAASTERDADQRFGAGDPHDELTRLAATFDLMLDRLRASLRHEQRLSAELSHELRTPLAAIAAESELALRREREPSEYRRALETIAERARQLERTLETLIAAAQAESSAPRGTADVQDVAERAAAACSPLAAERGIEVRVSGPRTPLRLGVDSDTGERILAPVLENACRYADTAVELQAAANGSAIEFRISDDGPGVDPADSERIFEPGERGSLGSATDPLGAGLGLPLARRLARAVDGDVECLDTDSGALFRVRVPFG
jgi:signal transduction histidine kinase